VALPISSKGRRQFLKCGACAFGAAVLTACQDSESSSTLPLTPVALGPVADFPVGATVSTLERLVIVRDEAGFGAMSLRCTHQECLVAYGGPAQPIECPCHGAQFTAEGVVLRGPAPVDLPWYEVRVTPPGILEVFVGVIVPRTTRFPWVGVR